MRLPKEFLIGASTAAHQVEGNNIHSDYWMMEQLEGTSFKERSGIAVDHYNRFKQDIQFMAELGLNAYRFSIEWARIEPEEGRFDEKEVAHYHNVLQACHDNGITPIVTLHHFTSPQWLITAGGWRSSETPARFAKYCEFIMSELGELIPYVCTINEANMPLALTKIMKKYQASSGVAQIGINTEVQRNREKYKAQMAEAFRISADEVHVFLSPMTSADIGLIFQAHTEARQAIRRVSPSTKVGITLSLYDIQALPGGEALAEEAMHEEFLQFLPYLTEDDFFGLQNYTRMIYGPDGPLAVPESAEKTQMGNEYYPQALEAVIRYASKHLSIPIIVTENGVATDQDERRIAFIDTALHGIQACLDEGIQVLGYMHWSLLDNFEWQLGYSKRFGLIEVNWETQERIPKPSAYHLGSIAKQIQ